MVGPHSRLGIEVRLMNLGKLSSRFEKLSVTARLQDTAYFMRSEEATRIQLVQAAFGRLEPSVHLVGAAPDTQAIYSLMSEEVGIGRLATVLSRPLCQPI